MKTYEWNAVINNGDLNFLVVQIGNTLSFFDKSQSPLNAGVLPFTVNLNSHAVAGVTDTSAAGIQVAAGKGALFVVGELIEPFYIEYDINGNTITETAITFQIRDMDRVDPTLGLEEQPTSLSVEQRYDYYNQGWYATAKVYDTKTETDGGYDNQVLDFYFSTRGKYPPLTKPWWVGKRIGDKGPFVFDPSGVYDEIAGGNTEASLGHYIINPFNKDRDTASSLTGIETISTDDRPKATSWYAGRLFYGFRNKIFYCQLLENDLTVSGKCYQRADPTAEEISDLVATDGGVVQIPESGDIFALVPVGNSLIIFSVKGVWSLGGTSVGDGFSAKGFAINKVTSLGAVGPRTIIDVEGNPTWWGTQGIYKLDSGDTNLTSLTQSFSVTNLCTQKTQKFYDDIPSLSKKYASAAYDKIAKKIVWMFEGTDPTATSNLYRCDRNLNYDMVYEAFNPYTISNLVSSSPYITDVFSLETSGAQRTTQNVIDAAGNNIVDSVSNQVVAVTGSVLVSPNLGSVGVKFLTVTP